MANTTLPASNAIVTSTASIFGGVLANATCNNYSVTDPDGSPIEIQGNDGRTKWAHLVDNGFNVTAEFVHESSGITWPDKGATIAITLPGQSALTFYVARKPQVSGALRKEVTVSYEFHYRPGMSL